MVGGAIWATTRYSLQEDYRIPLEALSPADYPEAPEPRSQIFRDSPYSFLHLHHLTGTQYQLVLEADPHSHTTSIELSPVNLALLMPTPAPWVRSDRDLTTISIVDHEWNRQQVHFPITSPVVHFLPGGDGSKTQPLTAIDLARNCLNAGLWELILWTNAGGREMVVAHFWFSFPLGLYKHLFEAVTHLSYWTYWWSLEHWHDPAGTPVHLGHLRMVTQEWRVPASAHWDEAPLWPAEQVAKRHNILSVPISTYRDWYTHPLAFAGFIPPGRYSLTHPHAAHLETLASFQHATWRTVLVNGHLRIELDLQFLDPQKGTSSHLLFGGFTLSELPLASPDQPADIWQNPMGIGTPPFVESYQTLQTVSTAERTFYGLHLDDRGRWLNHHDIGVDGPLLFRDRHHPVIIHLYLLSYERHALLNHFTLTCPQVLCGSSRASTGAPETLS